MLARTAEVVEYLHHLNLAVDQSALDPADRVTARREVRQDLGLSRGQVFALSADMPHGRDQQIAMASMIQLVLKTSILLTVLAIGLSTRPQDIAHVLRRPGLLFTSLLSISVAMPLFAACMVAVTHLLPVVQIALIALSVSPIPPMLPKKARKAAGDASYAIGLLVAVALLAIATVPLSVHFLREIFGRQAAISPTTIASISATNVLVPMGAGLLVHHFTHSLAERVARPVSVLASILLFASILPILFTAAPAIVSLIGGGTLAAVAAFVRLDLASATCWVDPIRPIEPSWP